MTALLRQSVYGHVAGYDDVNDADRLQLFGLAYNLANFVRRLALPGSVKHWSLTTLRDGIEKADCEVTRRECVRRTGLAFVRTQFGVRFRTRERRMDEDGA